MSELEPTEIIYLPGDELRALEDEVWAEYEQLYEPDDAVNRFLGWRATHKQAVVVEVETGGTP